MPTFVKGLDLCERFYHDAVAPVLVRFFPGLRHSAARLDSGSDVLGFDTPQSMDHDWGPKFTLFLREEDFLESKDKISDVLGHELPFEIMGFPTHFGFHADQTSDLTPTTQRPVRHGVSVTTPARFFKEYLGLGSLGSIGERERLLFPQQKLRTIASGRVFHDGLGELKDLRARLAWYPQDLWLHVMACQWQRINQEEPFMARCGDVGDELGSRLLGARLVAEIMKLGFLMERQYAPYSKWFGTAFSRLGISAELAPIFQKVLGSTGWKEREEHLGAAYLVAIRKHNSLGLTPKVEEKIAPFWQRPYLVPGSGRVAEALYAAVKSETVRALPKHVGSVDQVVDSVDVLTRPQRCLDLGNLHQGSTP